MVNKQMTLEQGDTMRSQINDKRVVKLEELNSENHIEWLGGRPQRDNDISKDDLLNLKIALSECKSLEDFLKAV